MTWVLLAVVVVLLVIIGVLVARRRRSRRLKDEFGPEYGRVVAERGDQRAAEKELADRRQRVGKFEIRGSIPPPASAIWSNGRRLSATSWMSRWVPLAKPMSLCSE